jgi:hypothetical protein
MDKDRKKYESMYKWRDKNREKLNEYQRTWRKNHKHRTKESDLKKTYGISLDEVKLILKYQNNECKICHKTLEIMSRDCCVDHDHKTGIIRGILCRNCNYGLGNFQDKIELLYLAIDYLKIANP